MLIYLSFRQGFEFSIKIPLRILTAVVVIGSVGYVLYQADYLPTTLRSRIDRTLAFEETLVDDRRRLAVAGWLAFEESPFVGVGLG